MAKLISFKKIDKNFIYPLISIIIIVLEYAFWEEYLLENIEKHKLVFNICQSISKCLLIIPYFVFKSKNKVNELYKLNDQSLYKKDYYEKYKKIRMKKYAFIFISNVLNLIFKITYFGVFFRITVFGFDIFPIVLITLFSYFILKMQIYRHQYLSIITIVTLLISIKIINSKIDIRFIDILLNSFANICYSLNIVLKKYIMENLFCTTYEIVFYEGIYSLIAFSILLTIYTNIEIGEKENCSRIIINEKCYYDNFYDYIDTLKNVSEVFIFLFVMIYYIFYYIFFVFTIKDFTPFHTLLIILFEEFIQYYYVSNIYYIIINSLLILLIFFMFLVFIEVIELNFCGLQKNTKRNIMERSQSEIENNIDNRDSDISNNRDSLLEMEETARDSQ